MITTITQPSLQYLHLNEIRASYVGLARAIGVSCDELAGIGNEHMFSGLGRKPDYIIRNYIKENVLTRHAGFPNLKYLYLGGFLASGVFKYFCHNAEGRYRWTVDRLLPVATILILVPSVDTFKELEEIYFDGFISYHGDEMASFGDIRDALDLTVAKKPLAARV